MLGLPKEEIERVNKDFNIFKVFIFSAIILIIIIVIIMTKNSPIDSPCQQQNEMLAMEIKGVIFEKDQIKVDKLNIKSPINKITLYFYKGQINGSIWNKSRVGDSVIKKAGENKIILKGWKRTEELTFLNLIDSCK